MGAWVGAGRGPEGLFLSLSSPNCCGHACCPARNACWTACASTCCQMAVRRGRGAAAAAPHCFQLRAPSSLPRTG